MLLIVAIMAVAQTSKALKSLTLSEIMHSF